MLIGVDQVLLDVLVPVDDDPGLLERHQIKQNSQSVAEEKHLPLVKESLAKIETGKARATCGGVIANSLRAGSWWTKKQGCAYAPRNIMLGRVGPDSAGKRLREELVAAGVEPFFEEARPAELEGTGACCCFLANKARTMLTYLGASKTLDLSVPSESFPSLEARIDTLQEPLSDAAPCVFLTSGFYVQADPAGVESIRLWCSKSHSTKAGGQILPAFAMTVGAEWCTELEAVQAAARSADFTFANEAEVLHLASSVCKAGGQAPPADYESAMSVIAQWKERGWMIGTRGSMGVGYIRASESQVHTVPVSRVPPEEFVDDVGAGDALMGGFLASIWQRLQELARATGKFEGRKRKLEGHLTDDVTRKDIQDAVSAGITAAAACVRCSGCQFPP
ncbi:Adenosine kinase 2 (AK 2) (Adenosine 5'-phosphotransferase 2) [Durusdinium trenchii]|uniref:Adenosine kinase n=1 Tax=Durusdinium trenchii TaxID=1381693 RepID=A0ABP0LCW1_9DINO